MKIYQEDQTCIYHQECCFKFFWWEITFWKIHFFLSETYLEQLCRKYTQMFLISIHYIANAFWVNSAYWMAYLVFHRVAQFFVTKTPFFTIAWKCAFFVGPYKLSNCWLSLKALRKLSERRFSESFLKTLRKLSASSLKTLQKQADFCWQPSKNKLTFVESSTKAFQKVRKSQQSFATK